MTVKGALQEVQKPQASSGTHSGGSVATRITEWKTGSTVWAGAREGLEAWLVDRHLSSYSSGLTVGLSVTPSD